MTISSRNNYSKALLEYFDKYIPLSTDEKSMVTSNFHPQLFKKRQYILQEGSICNFFYFVVKGCLRMYKIDLDGGIHIIQFAPENSWINDLGSFHGQKASALNIDALEDTVVLKIKREDLISIYLDSAKFNRIFRVIMENGFIRLQERLLQNISSTADDRYFSFVESYPNLANRISQVQIAAYIGIAPESLSRLRNRLGKLPGFKLP